MSKNFKNSTVERFRNSRGQDVPVDTFLYACLEAEQTNKAQNAGKKPIRWPNLTYLSEADLRQEMKDTQLKDTYEDLLSWYAANYPDLATSTPWDYGVVSIVVQPLVSLAVDLNTVHEKKFDLPLPEFNDSSDSSSAWFLIRSLIERFFASKSNYLMSYLEWTFRPANSGIDIGEIGNRPPVGRYSPHARRPSSSTGGPPKPREGRRPEGNNGNGGGDSFQGRPPRSNGGDRDNNRGPRNNNNNRPSANGNQRNNNHRPRNHQPETNAELEAAVIQECKDAISQLDQNPQEEKITLKPQNSFYRRIQHQVIVSNGFHSESVGEGNERAVAVWRPGR